jgi:UDP-3-O-[3-hydroxymyristoyl] glucosamine N-acyltransferase
VLAQAAVCVEARIGEACIINTRSSVDHECVLGQGVHIAPGATGGQRDGRRFLCGPGSGRSAAREDRQVIVGAGSVVTKRPR